VNAISLSPHWLNKLSWFFLNFFYETRRVSEGFSVLFPLLLQQWHVESNWQLKYHPFLNLSRFISFFGQHRTDEMSWATLVDQAYL
jgi:hypothetical protein